MPNPVAVFSALGLLMVLPVVQFETRLDVAGYETDRCESILAPACPYFFTCLAMIGSLTLSYVACWMIFFFTSSSSRASGRSSMGRHYLSRPQISGP